MPSKCIVLALSKSDQVSVTVVNGEWIRIMMFTCLGPNPDHFTDIDSTSSGMVEKIWLPRENHRPSDDKTIVKLSKLVSYHWDPNWKLDAKRPCDP